MGLRQIIVSGTAGALLGAGLTGLSTLRDSNALVCSSKPSRVTRASRKRSLPTGCSASRRIWWRCGSRSGRAIMDLSDAQLRGVLAKVREYAGNQLPAVTPARPYPNGGPDPIRQAMPTEIRRSLMVLTEDRLRRVWPVPPQP